MNQIRTSKNVKREQLSICRRSFRSWCAMAVAMLWINCHAPGRCKISGAWIGQHFNVPIEQVALVDSPQGPLLLTYAGRTYVGYSMGPDGRIEAEQFHYQGGTSLLSDRIECAEFDGKMLRLVTSQQFIDISLSRTDSDFFRFDDDAQGVSIPLIEIMRCAVIDGRRYVVWSRNLSSISDANIEIGLGYLDSNHQIHRLGVPFYRGESSSVRAALRMPGTFDRDSRLWLLDVPTQGVLLRVSLDGTVMDREPVGGTTPYLLHWLKMDDSRWSGLHGGQWIWFELTRRPIDAPVEAGLAVSNTAQSLQFRLPGDDVLLVAASTDGLRVRRWDAKTASLGPIIHTPMTIETCDIALSAY